MGLTCTTCGSPEVIAVKPGSCEEASDALPALVIKRPQPDECYCWKHWPCRAAQPDLFETAP